jgi:hypothetical protein
VEENITKPESFWARHSGLLAISIALVGFTLGMLQDIFLVSEGFSRWSLIILSNMFTGSIAGLLFYQYARNERTRRDLVRQRMQTIVELNHHIRNALQVIKFWGVQHQNCVLDDAQAQLMKDSVDRIEWALREVLPRYPEPTTVRNAGPESAPASTEINSRATAFYSSKVIDERKP